MTTNVLKTVMRKAATRPQAFATVACLVTMVAAVLFSVETVKTRYVHKRMVPAQVVNRVTMVICVNHSVIQTALMNFVINLMEHVSRDVSTDSSRQTVLNLAQMLARDFVFRPLDGALRGARMGILDTIALASVQAIVMTRNAISLVVDALKDAMMDTSVRLVMNPAQQTAFNSAIRKTDHVHLDAWMVDTERTVNVYVLRTVPAKNAFKRMPPVPMVVNQVGWVNSAKIVSN